MPGGFRLLWIAAGLSLMAGVAWAGDNSAPSTTPPAGPPKAKVDTVVDTIHGHKIADPYRWLEDAEQSGLAGVCAGRDGLHPQPA